MKLRMSLVALLAIAVPVAWCIAALGLTRQAWTLALLMVLVSLLLWLPAGLWIAQARTRGWAAVRAVGFGAFSPLVGSMLVAPIGGVYLVTMVFPEAVFPVGILTGALVFAIMRIGPRRTLTCA